jgi:hypothetical protein
VWSSSRRVKAAEDREVAVDAHLSFPTATEILRRHSVEWAIGFAVFFVILAITDFPFWQRLGIAGVPAIAFGYVAFSERAGGSCGSRPPFTGWEATPGIGC